MSPPPPELPSDSVYTSYWCEENIYLLAQSFLRNNPGATIWDIYVVFISNPSQTIALWNQKVAKDEFSAVVWDYHVILLLRRRNLEQEEAYPGRQTDRTSEGLVLQHQEVSHVAAAGDRSWVYDFDSRLPMPSTLEAYLDHTFMVVPHQYQSLFRVIPGSVYLENFASDRSHMLRKDLHHDNLAVSSDEYATAHTYISPPPAYPPLQGIKAVEKGITNNLELMRTIGVLESVPSSSGEVYGTVMDLREISSWR